MPRSATPGIDPWVRHVLRCPVTGAELIDGTGPDGQPELVSASEVNRLAYPVRDGVPILLAAEARRVDTAPPED
ncbi:Trm112 family protein [Georgenia deserti]|uniref:Trm112 family protein n=1 Tax=Georgenia deserti TaxID=2093781 RepID=A0ABW4L024_9MICO